MRNILTIAICALAIGVSGMEPFLTTDDAWVTRENFLEEFYGGAKERIAIGLLGNATLYKDTNFAWNINSKFGNNTARLDPYLYRAVPSFVAVTNWEVGAYDNVPYGAISNWTWQSMYQYLKGHFVNSDGTVGVGVYTNDGASTNWYWTQSWETNAWEICLGSLTYSVTQKFLLTNVVGAVTNVVPAWRCGWVYTDGDRLVKRGRNEVFDMPWEWQDEDGDWWRVTSSSGQYGFLFDWTDETLLTNELRVATGTTNWSSLATDLTLTIRGWTNYDYYSYIWYDVPMLPSSNTVDVSGLAASYTGAIPTMAWDLAGYISTVGSGSHPWVDGLVITNTATVTNFSGANHIGDTISVWLRCGGRLYILPSTYYGIGDFLNPDYNYPTPVQPFITREMLNERFAVMQLLKVTDGLGALSYWTGRGETNTASGSSGHSNTWNQAKNGAEGAYALSPGNVPFSCSSGDYYYWGSPDYGYRFRASLSKGYAYGCGSIPAGWANTRTNLSLRCDTYAYAQGGPPTYPGGAAGVFDANGDDVINTNWSFFSTTSYTPGWTNVTSGPLGSSPTVKPTWCDEPAVGASTNKGWSLPTHYHYFDVVPEPPKMLIYWGFQYVTNSL